MEHLVVTNPPHAQTIDKIRLGQIFNRTAMEAGMMARFPVPEIWSIETSEDEAYVKRDMFQDCGVRCDVFNTAQIRAIPDPVFVDYFEIDLDTMTVFEAGRDEGIRFNWSALRLVVIWEMRDPRAGMEAVSLGDKIKYARKIGAAKGKLVKPRGMMGLVLNKVGHVKKERDAAFARKRERHMRMFAGFDPFMDFFIDMPDSTVFRFRIQQNAVDYRGLGDMLKATSSLNWNILKQRVLAAVGDDVDTRCQNVSPRVPPCGLNDLVGELGADIGEPEVLSAMLCYLTSTQFSASARYAFFPGDDPVDPSEDAPRLTSDPDRNHAPSHHRRRRFDP